MKCKKIDFVIHIKSELTQDLQEILNKKVESYENVMLIYGEDLDIYC